MAAALFVIRNSVRGSCQKLLFSNPCLASLVNKPVLTHVNHSEKQVVPYTAAKSFSLTSKLPSGIESQHAGHDHSKMWTIERALSVSLLGIIPAAFIIQTSPMDYLLSLTVIIHSHWGLETIIIDYIRPKIFGPTIPKIALAALYGMSIFALGGLFYFNYTDVGLVNAIKMLWKL